MAAENILQKLFGTCRVNRCLARLAGAVRNCMQLFTAKTTKAP